MKLSIDRIIAWLGPLFAVTSASAAAWLVARVNVLGIHGLNKANTATWIAAGLVFLVTAGLHALGGWKWLQGRHIILASQYPAIHLPGPEGPAGPAGDAGAAGARGKVGPAGATS